MKMGQKVEKTHYERVCQDLCDCNSTYMLTHKHSDDISRLQVNDTIPSGTKFISIYKKFFIDNTVVCSGENNLCVSVECIGDAGIPLKGYYPCYVKVGGVRNWIMKNKNNTYRVFLQIDTNSDDISNKNKFLSRYNLSYQTLKNPECNIQSPQYKSPSPKKKTLCEDVVDIHGNECS